MLYLFTYRELIYNFIKRDLDTKYVGSLLGIYWSIINPIITLVIYIIVFGLFFKTRIPGNDSIWDFSLYFAAGFLTWSAFQSAVMRSSKSIVENKNYIKKVPFPNEIFPLYTTLAESIDLLIGIAIYLVLFLILKGLPSPVLILLPALILLQVIFTLGFSYLLSAATVFFRDIPQIVGSVFQIWFWATPIVYTIDLVPKEILWIWSLNPMYSLLSMYRDILLFGNVPEIGSIVGFGFLAIFFLAGSAWVFNRIKSGFSELL